MLSKILDLIFHHKILDLPKANLSRTIDVKDNEKTDRNFQGRNVKTKANIGKVAAFATSEENRGTDFVNDYEEDAEQVEIISDDNMDRDRIKAIEYKVEEVEEMTRLGLIRAKEII